MLNVEEASYGPEIEIRGLRKKFGRKEVLHGLDLVVQPGKLTGFLGPNGAGKTTTIRIVLGLIYRTVGSVRLFGQDVSIKAKHLRRRVGYLPAEVRFPVGMNGMQVLTYFSGARRVDCMSEALRLSERLSLDLAKPARTYSTGNRQKLGLIQAMMHRPQLLILDEPTSGLDPLIREILFDELRSITADGRTVLFSSHTLSEVESLCDDVIIVREGRVIESGPIQLLRSKALRQVHLQFANERAIPEQWPSSYKPIQRTESGLQAEVCFKGAWTGSTPELLAWMSRLDLADAFIEKPDLEDLFLSYYGETPTPSSMDRSRWYPK